MAIGYYSINDYWWVLVAIESYFINGYRWLLYYKYCWLLYVILQLLVIILL